MAADFTNELRDKIMGSEQSIETIERRMEIIEKGVLVCMNMVTRFDEHEKSEERWLAQNHEEHGLIRIQLTDYRNAVLKLGGWILGSVVIAAGSGLIYKALS